MKTPFPSLKIENLEIMSKMKYFTNSIVLPALVLATTTPVNARLSKANNDAPDFREILEQLSALGNKAAETQKDLAHVLKVNVTWMKPSFRRAALDGYLDNISAVPRLERRGLFSFKQQIFFGCDELGLKLLKIGEWEKKRLQNEHGGVLTPKGDEDVSGNPQFSLAQQYVHGIDPDGYLLDPNDWDDLRTEIHKTKTQEKGITLGSLVYGTTFDEVSVDAQKSEEELYSSSFCWLNKRKRRSRAKNPTTSVSAGVDGTTKITTASTEKDSATVVEEDHSGTSPSFDDFCALLRGSTSLTGEIVADANGFHFEGGATSSVADDEMNLDSEEAAAYFEIHGRNPLARLDDHFATMDIDFLKNKVRVLKQLFGKLSHVDGDLVEDEELKNIKTEMELAEGILKSRIAPSSPAPKKTAFGVTREMEKIIKSHFDMMITGAADEVSTIATGATGAGVTGATAAINAFSNSNVSVSPVSGAQIKTHLSKVLRFVGKTFDVDSKFLSEQIYTREDFTEVMSLCVCKPLYQILEDFEKEAEQECKQKQKSSGIASMTAYGVPGSERWQRQLRSEGYTESQVQAKVKEIEDRKEKREAENMHKTRKGMLARVY